MALLTCSECGNEASTSARTCPHCGASRKAMRHKPASKLFRYGLIAVIAIFFTLAALIATQPKPVKTAEELKADHNEGVRLGRARTAAGLLKASLRDPDSLAFEKIVASEEGEAICIRYRARNGFGGMGGGLFVFTAKGAFTSAKAWNRNCLHRPMYDYTDTLPMMLRM